MTTNASEDLARLIITTGPNVCLRRKTREDATQDYRWRTNPENARFDGQTPLQQTFDQFLRQLESDLAFGHAERETFAITTVEGRHIGNLMYYNADSIAGEAEFGINLGTEELRGHGAGTEATVLFLDYLWANRPFRRVHLHTLLWNERAIRSFRKAGFSDAGTIERNGETYLRMEVRREWWLLWKTEGRFAAYLPS